MARGEIRYTLSADGTPMRQELSKAESDLKKWQGLVGRVSRDIEGSEQRTAKEIAAVGAAVKKLGGEAQLSEPQLKRVAARLAELEQKGGKIPPQLKAIADRFKEGAGGAAAMAKEIAAIKSEKLDEIAAKGGLIGRVLTAMGPAGLAAAAALAITVGAATAVAGTLTSATKEAVTYSDKVTNMSAVTDIGTEALQRFEHVARLSGGSTEGLATASLKLKNNLVNAPEKFDQLGLSAARLRNLAPEAQLQAVATALQKIEDPTLRDAVAMDVLGAKSSSVFPILKANIAAIGDEAERLGLVLSKGTVAALDDLGDSASTLDATWTALWRQLGGAIGSAPALKGIFDDLANLVGHAASAVRDAAPVIRAFAESGLGYLRDVMKGFGVPAGIFIDSMSNIAKALIVVPGLLDAVKDAMARLARQAVSTFPGGTLALGAMDLAAGAGGGGGTAPRGLITRSLPTGPQDSDPALTPTERLKAATAKIHEVLAEQQKKALKAAEDAQRYLREAAQEYLKAWSNFSNELASSAESTARESAKRMRTTAEDLMNQALLNAPGVKLSSGMIEALGAKALTVPTGLGGKPKQFNLGFNGALGTQPRVGADPVTKPSFDAAQALQNLANIASTSSSKLAKAFASITGGGAGIAGGLGALFGIGGQKKESFGSGLTGILGKAGAWGQVATSVLSIGSSIFGLFKKKPKPAPEPPPPPKEHVDVDAGTLSGSLGGATKGIVATSAEDVRSQSKLLSLSFWQVFTEQGLVAAASSFKEVFTSVREKLGSLGGDATAEAILGPIATIMDRIETDSGFKAAAEGSHEYAGFLKELRTKEVPLTIDQFQALEQQLNAAKVQAESGGATSKESFAAIAPFLQEVVRTAQQYGFTIDENTQKLIDQAKAAGIAFPTDPLDRFIAKLDELLSKLLGIDGKSVNVGVTGTVRTTKEDASVDGAGGIPGFARGTRGLRDFGDETIVALHNREAVVPEDEYSALVNNSASEQASQAVTDLGQVFGDIVGDISGRISDLAQAVARMAESGGNVVIQPQVAVAVDAGSVRRNQQDLLDNVQEETASAIRRGTSPILAALRDRGYRSGKG